MDWLDKPLTVRSFLESIIFGLAFIIIWITGGLILIVYMVFATVLVVGSLYLIHRLTGISIEGKRK